MYFLTNKIFHRKFYCTIVRQTMKRYLTAAPKHKTEKNAFKVQPTIIFIIFTSNIKQHLHPDFQLSLTFRFSKSIYAYVEIFVVRMDLETNFTAVEKFSIFGAQVPFHSPPHFMYLPLDPNGIHFTIYCHSITFFTIRFGKNYLLVSFFQ